MEMIIVLLVIIILLLLLRGDNEQDRGFRWIENPLPENPQPPPKNPPAPLM